MPSSHVLRLARAALLACVIARAGSGCDSGDPPGRLELRGVETHDDPQRAFSVLGKDLPVGSAGSVTLEGTWFAALEAGRPAHLELPCTVTGSGEAVVLRDALPSSLVPGTFSGELTLALHGDNRDFRSVPLTTALAIDGEHAHAAQRLLLQQRMQVTRDRLGVGLALQPGRGLIVTKLLATGVAAKAGVEPGDLLLRLAGAPLLLDSAFALPEAGGPAELVYLRGGVEHTTALSPLEADRSPLDLRVALWIAFVFACAGAFMAARAKPTAHALATPHAQLAALACALLLGAGGAASVSWWLVALSALPEIAALRNAGSRRAVLLATARLSCALLASAACVVQARTSAHLSVALPLASAPWLWLCLPAMARPACDTWGPRTANVVGSAASCVLWAHAAFGAGAPHVHALAVALAIVCLVAARGGDTLLRDAGAATLALLLATWAPTLTALALPLTILTWAALGLLCGRFVRTRAEELLATRSAVRGVSGVDGLST